MGLLCMPADVILRSWQVSQEPEATIFKNINSSTKITCSTSLSEPLGVGLYRKFNNSQIAYLDFNYSQVLKSTIDAEFKGRTDITKEQQMTEGFRFNFQLSMLKQDDTDLYYCRWVFFSSTTFKIMTLSSKDTLIIVREEEPQQQCKEHVEDLIFIILSATTAFIAILFVVIAALIVKCKRFKKTFRPARAVKPPRPHRPQHVCPEHSHHHVPYLITSLHNTDFRGIL